ncbi:MAG: hypothetical protein IJJ60_02800, partial [Clostridia bacterium]|nr:hypothetical protein [Clostridia bacterium]
IPLAQRMPSVQCITPPSWTPRLSSDKRLKRTPSPLRRSAATKELPVPYTQKTRKQHFLSLLDYYMRI